MYSATQTSDAVYIIGGAETNDIVAEFKNNQWRRLPNLNQRRDSHGSITFGGQTMIIGGIFDIMSSIPLVTEVWELGNGKNKIIEPSVDPSVGSGIALYIVKKDFCKSPKRKGD